VIPGSAARAESGVIPAHDRGGAPKGERSAYRAAAAPAHRGAATVVRRSALRLPLFGEQRQPPPVRSRQAFFESVKADPDANRIAAMQFRVVIAGLAAGDESVRRCLTWWIGQ
jgi:hypothetical protein